MSRLTDFLDKKGCHYDMVPMSGLEVCALWDTKDKHAWNFYDRTIEINVGRELAIKNSQYFDEQLLLRYNDQRTAADPKLEPLQIGCKRNKLLKDGITRLNQLSANRSGDFFYFYASGTGTSNPTVGQTKLDAENARVDMRRDGILDAFGNILFMRARFATGIPSATIREFGACDTAEDPSIFCWRVLLSTTEQLIHTQGETWYNGSHYIITYSR